MTEPFTLAAGFLAKQNHMLTGLGLTPAFTDHSTTKGDASEDQWRDVLAEFLPARYGVGPIFAIDSTGKQSDQIDLAIFDKQYSPLFFEMGGINFVPAESVYAVFEVRPKLNKANLEYASAKVASVRDLTRTSVPIVHAGGEYEAQSPESKPILGGVLAMDSEWVDLQGDAALDAIASSGLDLGIAARVGAFSRDESAEFSPPEQQLIWFAMRLYKRLSRLGTVLALDLDAYYAPQTARD